jgi:hypothetical protein
MIITEDGVEERTDSLVTPNEGYLREVCAFAIALHRGTGFRLLELRQGELIRHIVVSRPDGNLHGIHGVYTEKQCCLIFFSRPPYEFCLTVEEDLRKIVPVDEIEIIHATKIARGLWPELPWK